MIGGWGGRVGSRGSVLIVVSDPSLKLILTKNAVIFSSYIVSILSID